MPKDETNDNDDNGKDKNNIPIHNNFYSFDPANVRFFFARSMDMISKSTFSDMSDTLNKIWGINMFASSTKNNNSKDKKKKSRSKNKKV